MHSKLGAFSGEEVSEVIDDVLPRRNDATPDVVLASVPFDPSKTNLRVCTAPLFDKRPDLAPKIRIAGTSMASTIKVSTKGNFRRLAIC